MRRSLIHTLCGLAALAMLLHGVAAMGCQSAPPGNGADMELADEMITHCPACGKIDTSMVGADACSVACSPLTACVQAVAVGAAGGAAFVLPGSSLRTERPQTVEPPPPRSMLLV